MENTTTEPKTELLVLIEKENLEPATQQSLLDSFAPFFAQAEEWKAKAATLTVTDVTQVREMKMAREARLALRELEEKRESEKRKELEAAAHAKKLERAPDKQKLLLIAKELKALYPEGSIELKSAEARKVLAGVKELLIKTADYITNNVNAI
jgi:hypothetical protein